MKRSEMFSIIKIVIATGPSGNDIDRYIENILSSIEKAGMAPPFDNDVFIRQKNRWGIESAHGREWTNEDD